MSRKKISKTASTVNCHLTAIDLYSGSGAVSEGLRRIGFKVLAAIDSDPICCRTYRANHDKVRLYEGDIRGIIPAQVRIDLELQGEVDLLVVCAPCQPFSTQNKKRFQDDPRCWISCDHIPRRSWALFRARDVMRSLIESFKGEQAT